MPWVIQRRRSSKWVVLRSSRTEYGTREEAERYMRLECPTELRTESLSGIPESVVRVRET